MQRFKNTKMVVYFGAAVSSALHGVGDQLRVLFCEHLLMSLRFFTVPPSIVACSDDDDDMMTSTSEHRSVSSILTCPSL
jgi:hypothetical protein